MYVGFYSFYKFLNKNRMFAVDGSHLGDELMWPWVYMKEYLEIQGHRVATIDTDDLEKFDVVVILEHPTILDPLFRKLLRLKTPLHLFIVEVPAIRPDNWFKFNHRAFQKVFVLRDDWVDEQKYHRWYFPVRLPERFSIEKKERPIFCSLIACQKYAAHPREVYSERYRAIRWFEKNQPEKFALYGLDWDRFYFRGPLAYFNHLLSPLYRKYPNLPRRKHFPSWRGKVDRKREILQQSRFSICYENTVYKGQITEKIFDCFFNGCIPVYLGATNIEDLVDPRTFIDRRHFKNYDDLYAYLSGMSEQEYHGYLHAIESFVQGPDIYKFGPHFFAELIEKKVVNAL